MEPSTTPTFTPPPTDPTDKAAAVASKRALVRMQLQWVAAFILAAILMGAANAMSLGGMENLRDSNLLYVLVGAAALSFMASFFVPSFMLRRSVKSLTFPIDSAQAFRVSYYPFAVRLVCCELIAVIGFIGSQSYGFVFYLPFWMWSLLALTLASPNESKFMTSIYQARQTIDER